MTNTLLVVTVILSGLVMSARAACSAGRTKREMRGAWIATVSNIDWPKDSSKSTSQNQADMRHLLDTLAAANINAVFFQVRPAGDAFYQSTIEPWSQWLTGHQGTAPSPAWDPLQFLIDECHKRSMEVHAWFNPYRAKSGSTSTTGLAANHMAKMFPSHAHAYGNNLWMDPGSSQVQDRVNDVILDVVKRYDIDGIHMDDYFYPYPTSTAFPDTATYNAYKNAGGTLSHNDWRRDNVNKLIERLSTNIHQTKAWVKFGVSPFGIWRSGNPSGVTGKSRDSVKFDVSPFGIWRSGNPSGVSGMSSVDEIYADSRLWLQKGWLDYIAPQLYWVIDGPQSFTKLVDWWSDPAQNPTNKHIYTGFADYRVVENNWSPNEIVHQIQQVQIRTSRNVWGGIHFSANQLETNAHGLVTALHTVYTGPTLTDVYSYRGGVSAPATPNLSATGGLLDWTGSVKANVRSWAVYRSTSNSCTLIKVLPVDTTTLTVSGTGDYVVTAVNRLGVEADSSPVTVTTIIG